MRRLSEAGLDVLLSVWHTPPSISEDGSCNAPPENLKDYADFIDHIIDRHGDTFQTLELWNEPNNFRKWNFNAFDPDWRKFGTMVGMAGHWARHRGKATVLGGMIPVDIDWLRLMDEYGVLDVVDAVAIHGFPGMWWTDHPNWDWHSHWNGWKEKVGSIAHYLENLPVWITETGIATWDLALSRTGKEDLQVHRLNKAVGAPVPRVYWYSLIDLSAERDAIEGFHVDENEYHMGLVTSDGRKKPSFARFKQLIAGEVRV